MGEQAASTSFPGAQVAPLAIITGLLLIGTTVVYATGGTGYAFPYIQLIPVLVAAARYQVRGGIITAIVGALLLGPLMPLDVDSATVQSTTNWLARLAFFVLLGGVTGWLFARLHTYTREDDRLAREDRSTGLPNRTALEEEIRAAIERHRAPEKARPVLFIVHITDFFEALDAVGADADDEIAAATARLIETSVNDLGRAYRFSPAEIAFVAEQVAPEHIASLASQVKSAGEDAVDVREVPVRVELCIGAARARTDDAGRPYELVRRAQLALITAEGRNQDYAIFEPAFERSMRETFYLITRMRRALDERQFELFYQPRVWLSDGSVDGVEALIRWRDPDGGIVPPGQFIPKVERTSLIGPLTRFACHEACSFARSHPDMSVSVNLSPRSVYDGQLLGDLCEMLDHFEGVAPRMEFEVTERALAHDPERAAECLSRLRRKGASIIIDDFGKDYSSFSWLHRLPVTGLKIDRAFMQELAKSARVKGVLRCMASAGHELDLRVTAEGVETSDQLAVVRDVGCELAQGFHFTKPLPADELERWLESYRPAEYRELRVVR